MRLLIRWPWEKDRIVVLSAKHYGTGIIRAASGTATLQVVMAPSVGGCALNAQLARKGKCPRNGSKNLTVLASSGTGDLKPHVRPTWDERLEELKQYKARHGDCNVPWNHGSLGKWVKRQRNVRKNGKLSDDRIQKLDELGFDWSPRMTWEERLLEALKEYMSGHGHCSVLTQEGSLGAWVGEQRRRKNKMSKEGMQKLDDLLGFDWKPQQSPRRTWDDLLGELMTYKTKHGHCNECSASRTRSERQPCREDKLGRGAE